jgi:hypothetical protein
MPLGISESTLRRAYGPLDLSYAYNKIESVQRQLAAEDRARKQEAAKQYYADLAAMEKEKVGVRAIDIPEISSLHKQWAATEKQLSANPNLITRNSDLYKDLKKQSNKLYSTLLTTIKGSKELGKQEVQDFREMANPQKMDFYRENAAADYKENVMNKPWSEVFKSGLADITKYYEGKIDGSKFYGDLGQRIESQATGKHSILDKTFKGVPGEVRYLEFDKMPMLGEIQQIVLDNLNAKLGKKANSFAAQQLTEAKDPKLGADYEVVKSAYNKFMEDGYKKYFDDKQPVIALFDQKNVSDKQDFVNYLTAKEFLSKLPPEGKLSKASFSSESAGMRYREGIKKKDGKEVEEAVDLYTPAVNTIVSVTSQPKFAGKNVTLESFQEEVQNLALQSARNRYSKEFTPKDLSLNYNPKKESLQVYSRVNIPDLKIKVGDYIGELSKTNLFIKGSKPAGVKAVKAGIQAAKDIKPTPVFKMN